MYMRRSLDDFRKPYGLTATGSRLDWRCRAALEGGLGVTTML
jgi:hypothetical protein